MLILPERMKAHAADIASLIENSQYEEAARIAPNISFARLASIISEAPREAILPFMEALGQHRAAQTLAEFPVELTAELILEAPEDVAAGWLSAMPSDVTVDILSWLPEERSAALVSKLPQEAGLEIKHLARFEEGTAGAEMSLNYMAVPTGKTVADVIEAVRAAPSRLTRTGYLYIVGENRVLQGVISIRDLLMSKPDESVEKVMKRDVFAARVYDDVVETAQRIRSRGLKMLPVITADDTLVGVITMEDAMEVLSYELASDLTSIGAVSVEESFYTPPRRAIRMRLPWMSANIFLNLGAVAVIASFEDTIAQVAILAAFLPMITDMGGNVGIQALSVSIRSIALGEARIRDYWLALRKEAAIGIVNGIALGILFGVIATMMEANPLLGVVAGTALGVNVFVAGVVGGTMPFLIKRLGKDPAMMTGPILTTITDITGVTIYLGLCTIFLAGLMG